jgi:DNA-binding NtrC family response regulator
LSQSNSVSATLSMDEGMSEAADLKTLMDRYERELIVAALRASGGHQRRAAACLGVLPTTLHEKMKRLGLIPRKQDDDRPAVGPDRE